ncbi:putative ferric-chelate reductase 1 [Fundulus heteroclitus]|uniref:putative ferric-chelate reductase 1 n=1 Tax=Fundulus heteroclitus TaxID=8078 RepID=UPI00165CC42A|nr:putative ferric-chelate reductase 1 [Fundulus heteroclitus]
MSTTLTSGMTTTAENTATSFAMSTTPNGDMTTIAENTATSPAMSTTPNGDMTTIAENTATSPAMSTTPNGDMTTIAENTATSPAMSTTPNGDMTTTAENTATSPAMSTTPNGDMTTIAENTATSPAMSTTPNGDMTTIAENTATSPDMSTTPTSGMTITAENTVTTAATENMSTTGSTQPPAVSPNNTVQTLETDIDRTQCGSDQLCVAEPPKCDPSATVSCFFLGAKRQSGQNFFFELSGESDGYIAATITDGNTKGDPTYICAKSKGRVQFIGALLKNGVLTPSELSVNSVKGKITGKRIQCSFLATVPDPRTRTTGIRLSVSTGDFNETDESLGAATPVIKTDPVDLGNPNITVTNVISPNTTTPSPTAAGNNLTTAAPSNNATTAAPSNNATTAAPSINATPAGPSITIIPQLVAPVSQEECGSTKLCVAEPSECDPSTGANCFFLSARRQSGQNFDFELSGQTRGYIAAGVSNAASQAGSHRAYICVNNNGAVGYLTGTIDNSVLNRTKVSYALHRKSWWEGVP